MPIELKAPLSDKDTKKLKAGDQVLISGTIYAARDQAHKKGIPFNVKGQIIFYAGPTPAKPGKIIGSIGPTTASRMDAYTPQLLAKGLKGMIGKGKRSEKVRQAVKKYKAVYFAATGGVAALLSKCVKSAKVIAYRDLGPEAVLELVVDKFPVIVGIDSFGRNIFK